MNMETNDVILQLKERVSKGLNFGIEAVEEVIDPSSAGYNDFVLLKSKYNDLMYLSSINTMPYEQIEIGLDRLRTNLLGLINNLGSSGLKKQQVEADMKVQALPTRRTNFFKLLDIHFQNLEEIAYTEVSGNEETRRTGREGVYYIHQMNKRRLKNQTAADPAGDLVMVNDYFKNLFTTDTGILEVYFKNIRHILAYIQESEIERAFFLDTAKSLFSRFEMGMIFYYALCGIDPEFKALVKKSNLIDSSLKPVLIRPEHFDFW